VVLFVAASLVDTVRLRGPSLCPAAAPLSAIVLHDLHDTQSLTLHTLLTELHHNLVVTHIQTNTHPHPHPHTHTPFACAPPPRPQYVSEAVIALSEAPLKNADIPSVLEMASALHSRYPDFATSLGPTLAKVVVVGAGAASKATPGGGGGGLRPLSGPGYRQSLTFGRAAHGLGTGGGGGWPHPSVPRPAVGCAGWCLAHLLAWLLA